MNIVYCRSCASELPDTAPSCLKCGAAQARVLNAAALMAGAAQPDAAPARAVRKIGGWIMALVLTGLLSTLVLLLYPVLVGLGWLP